MTNIRNIPYFSSDQLQTNLIRFTKLEAGDRQLIFLPGSFLRFFYKRSVEAGRQIDLLTNFSFVLDSRDAADEVVTADNRRSIRWPTKSAFTEAFSSDSKNS